MAVMPMLQKKLILFPNFSVPLSREIHIRLGVRLGHFRVIHAPPREWPLLAVDCL